MSPSTPTVDTVFLNVRRAYRLLHDYHSMVLDVVRYLSAQFDVSETGGVPGFSEDAKGAYRYLRQPAWSWLPMMSYEFHFAKNLGQNDWLSLSLLVISDTGFIEGNLAVVDKENLSAFAPPELSSTKLAVLLRRMHWQPLPFLDNKVQLRKFIREDGNLPDDMLATGFAGKCYDMSLLTNEAGANKVVSEVIEIAKANSLPLELVKGVAGKA